MAYKSKSPLPIAEGGTNATTMATTDGVVYFDGTRLVTTAVGTATQVLTSNGAGVAPTFQAAGGSGSITITGDSGGGLTGSSFTFTGGSTGLSFGGSGTTQTLTFAGITANAGQINLATDDGVDAVVIGVGAGGRNLYFGDGDAGNYTVNIGGCNGDTNDSSTINIGSAQNATTINCNIGTGQNLTNFNWNVGTGQNLSNATVNMFNGENCASTINIGNTSEGTSIITIGSISSGSGSRTTIQSDSSTFMPGVQTSVTGSPVLISAANQLGITVSSSRYKENIKLLESTRVLELQPKRFNYKVGEDRSPQTGLIAEEVHKIMPELVVWDQEGLPQSVKYHELPVLLLLEIQKLRKEIDELKKRR
jgi:hypothetical protein